MQATLHILYTILHCVACSVNQVFITTVLAFSSTHFWRRGWDPKHLLDNYLNSIHRLIPLSRMLNMQICSLMLIVLLKAVFLSSIGGKTYDLHSLVGPDQPKDKSLADIIAVLQEHFDPKPTMIAERFQLHRRDQLPGESVADYVAELRCLSTNCEFGGHLNDALRDRLVCVLRPKEIARLTLSEAMDLAQAMETADKNSKELQGSKDVVVNSFFKTTNP